jgi:hypothetical protein
VETWDSDTPAPKPPIEKTGEINIILKIWNHAPIHPALSTTAENRGVSSGGNLFIIVDIRIMIGLAMRNAGMQCKLGIAWPLRPSDDLDLHPPMHPYGV